MEAIVRAIVIYALLLIVIRLSGKRTLAQLTVFDFVLMLVIAQATQNALLSDNSSITGAALIVLTLIGLNRMSDYISWRSDLADRLLNGVAVVLVEDGRLNEKYMSMYRITRERLLEQARNNQGIESIDQIKFAVLERTGLISIVPKNA